ncbi:MAG: STAS domain-containing protein [Acidimicrobiales bacterium]
MESSTSRLTITPSEEDPRHLVLSGDIDSYTAPDLDAALLALGPSADVHVELPGVAFIDSSGLRVLISAHTALEERGQRLVLSAPSRAVSRLFEISGLTEHFHLA